MIKNKIHKKNQLIIGNFECLHTGHLQLFKNSNNFSILTFRNIPRKQTNVLYSHREKLNNLYTLNPNKIYIYDVIKNNINADEFNEKILKKIKHDLIVVGDDFKYGNDFKDVNYLKKIFPIKIIKPKNIIHTNKIKALISKGNIEEANKFLVNKFYHTGKVIKGKQLGRKLGFRTANVIRDEKYSKIFPGIYSGYVYLNKIKRKAGIFVRNLNENTQLIEANILNKKYKDFYGKNIKVEFIKLINKTQNSKNLDELKKIISKNINLIKKDFNSL